MPNDECKDWKRYEMIERVTAFPRRAGPEVSDIITESSTSGRDPCIALHIPALGSFAFTIEQSRVLRSRLEQAERDAIETHQTYCLEMYAKSRVAELEARLAMRDARISYLENHLAAQNARIKG